MSNALCIPGAIAQTKATAIAQVDFTPHQATVLTGIVAAGIIVLAAWLFIRIIHADKFTLAKSPGRANSLNLAHIVVVLLAWLTVGILAHWLLGPLEKQQKSVLTMLVQQCVWLASALLVAAGAFHMGLGRGLGLSPRHWIYDTLRAVVGYLAAMPVCVGLLLLSLMVIPGRQHFALDLLEKASPLWKAVIAFCVVVMAPLSEEVFFRGLVQSLLRRTLRSPWLAILATSGLFGMLHWQTPQAAASLVALGIVLGYNYERTGRLLSSILIHAIFNAVFVSLTLWPG
ncbi:MAG: CPBP family intramembrane metalloprotease [Planctomycetes bacterium]|nr:CPBP family intramembrane metalloprotease [Planctomycetota bacterium]